MTLNLHLKKKFKLKAIGFKKTQNQRSKMSVGRVLVNLLTTDSLLLKINLVSIGLLIIFSQLHGAFGDLEPQPNFDDAVTKATVIILTFICLRVSYNFMLLHFRYIPNKIQLVIRKHHFMQQI